MKGVVCMDATADINPVYQLFDKATVLPTPPNARSYKNARLHVAWGHKTGKRYMTRKKKKVCADLIGDLNRRFKGTDRVFIATHKDVEDALWNYKRTFELMTGHYGAIAGSNEWRDCNKAVIFGLHHRPKTWSAVEYMGYRGPVDQEWLEGENRRFKNYRDIREAIEQGVLGADTVQAIQRICIRKTTDEEGNCPEADIYIMLPAKEKTNLGQNLLAMIKKHLPGIQIMKWDYEAQKQKKQQPRSSDHEKGLIVFLSNMLIGRYSASVVCKERGMNRKTLSTLMAKAQDPQSPLAVAMKKAGVRYEVIRKGKTQQAYFIKD
jgi:hypothetical protein